MKMRLVGKQQVTMDPKTFVPVLLVTIAIPLEPALSWGINTTSNGVDEAYEKIGAEFVRLLKTAEVEE